ncbi:INNER MEMBRANE TRANSPORTER YGJI-RELATED [Salix koriyanagi]|uniref:INNER MEMBRANE TRANSPORTER YGJI-RELATED n=1 Tax=Salix koriyanagi TaxID=2511006 RepID=A0A9Q0PIC6_9ROSI|nr:INNER MEMBRANE TRANSPORTER YGJI-RELATED [Salix koriyanagi]
MGDGNIHVDHQEEGMRRRGCGCSCSKNDFLPEESFQSFGNYLRALKETPIRFKDRLLTRSKDSTEIHEIKARSEHEMKRTLNWWDLIWLGIGSVVGAGIFVLTGLEARDHVGPAVVLSYLVSGVSAMLSVFCYTEFAVEIPVAELGDFMAFIAAGNILLEYVISGAAVARTWTSYFATICNHKPDDFRIITHSLPDDYGHLDPIVVVNHVQASLNQVGPQGNTKGSSRFNYVSSIIHFVVIFFIVVAGLAKAYTKNYIDFAPNGARGIFTASAVLFFAYVGFDAVSTMAEETKNPARDIPIGLVGSMAITIAKYIVDAGALKGMTSVLLVSAVGQARYLTHIARTHMMPPWLAHVDAKTGTPVNAAVVMLVATAIIAFFTKLDILSNLLSISTLFIFMLMAVSLLVRRYYVSGVTTAVNRAKLVVFIVIILGSSIATALIWGTTDQGSWIGYVITIPIWFFATLALKILSRKQRIQNYGVFHWCHGYHLLQFSSTFFFWDQ